MSYNIKVNKNFHFLTKNEKTTMPSHIICFDTETEVIDNQHKLKLGWAFYCKIENDKITRENKFFFTKKEQFWEFIKKWLKR